MNRFRVNAPDVSVEVFDQEVLAINLKSGHYSSIREAGVPFWRMLTEGFTTQQVAHAMAQAVNVEESVVLAHAEAFAAEAVASNLLIIQAEPALLPNPSQCDLPPGWTYKAPLVEHFTDMQELLLLDPVHEVSGAGWPNKPTPSGTSDQG